MRRNQNGIRWPSKNRNSLIKSSMSILFHYSFVFLVLFISCKDKANNELLFEILGPDKTGINFENNLKETLAMNGLFYEYYYNGGGLSVADFNNDGLQDVYFVSNLYPNRLFLNRGDLTFKDISKESGTTITQGFPTGVTTVDINSDGWMDIYVSVSGKYDDPRIRKNKLFINQGINKNGIPVFKEESRKYNLDLVLCSTQAAFFDFDRDNDLDLFLINHYPDVYDYTFAEVLLKTRGGITGDRLYENRDGKYIEITEKAGLVTNRLSYGLGLGISDLNNDGWPDVYISNDFSGKDKLYINNKNGTFTQRIDESVGHISYASMGNDLADFNNDGWSDIFTLEMTAEDHYTVKTSLGFMNNKKNFQKLVDLGLHHQYMFNTLQLNNGVLSSDETPLFSDIAQMAGIPSTDWSWAPLLFDMDNDGKKDLLIANGIKRDFINYDYLTSIEDKYRAIKKSHNLVKDELVSSVLNMMPTRKKNNYFFRNNGDLTFEKMNGVWAENMLTSSNGSAYADFDNDGDLDVVLNNSDAPAIIYKNNAREKRLGNYLQFKLKGPAKNPVGIGTKIIIKQSDQIQVREQYLTRGFQSSISTVLHFGLGLDKTVNEVRIIWPDGKMQVMGNVEVNRVITVSYNDANLEYHPVYETKSLFRDVTGVMKLNHKHEENEFNDFDRESLLPHKMSDLGPALAVADINNDGLEDFFIGGAKGRSGKLFVQTNESFQIAKSQPWSADKNSEDIDATFFDADGDGDLDLYVVSGGNEYNEGDQFLQDRLYLNIGSSIFKKSNGVLPMLSESGATVKACDYDGDGDIDLFVGGRQKPGEYPLPVSSHIIRNDTKAGKVMFSDVSSEIAPQLKDIGMVTDAVWTDINSDEMPDLIIVGEWMSIRVFENTGETFHDITSQTGLSKGIGWWNCITPYDFDNDGDMDFVVGNLGLNNKIKASENEPFEIYAKDFDNNGKQDLVLGYYYDNKLYPFHGLKALSMQLPILNRKFITYDSFGRATLVDIFGEERLKTALNYKATNFATCYVENLGDGTFKVKPLCNAAQVSSVNGIVVQDADNDGYMDLILAGNFYGFEVSIPRNDASIGLFLKGNGKGDFIPVPHYKSGLSVKGDVRHIQLIHIGKDAKNGVLAAKNDDFLQIIEIVNNGVKE